MAKSKVSTGPTDARVGEALAWLDGRGTKRNRDEELAGACRVLPQAHLFARCAHAGSADVLQGNHLARCPVTGPDRSRFTTPLRFELASEEERPLFVSYLGSSLLAVAWLVLVHAMPSPLVEPVIGDLVPPVITFAPRSLPITTAPSAARRAGSDRLGGRESSGGGLPTAVSVRDAFSGAVPLVDAGNLLHGVDVAPSGSTLGDPTALKVGLGTGVGSRTPGRARAGGLSPAGPGVGAVVGVGVSRTAVTIAPPEVRPLAVGAGAGNAGEVGQAARAHVPQLARCYHQEGLSRNAGLAGLVRLAITVEAGRVTSATILDRSWAGAGAAETERCLLQSVRGWRLGGSDARIVLPLSFTSAGR